MFQATQWVTQHFQCSVHFGYPSRNCKFTCFPEVWFGVPWKLANIARTHPGSAHTSDTASWKERTAHRNSCLEMFRLVHCFVLFNKGNKFVCRDKNTHQLVARKCRVSTFPDRRCTSVRSVSRFNNFLINH